jgi:hypothetical protein
MIAPGAGTPVGPKQIEHLWNENADLKRILGNVRESYEQLEHESNFNRIKAIELYDIAQMKGCEDDLHDKLVLKSMQNAELSLDSEKLKHELRQANSCILNLGKERENSKRMLLELADIVRTLQSVQVDYEVTSADKSYLRGQDASVRNIKNKVEAIMHDRNRLVSRCNKLEAENKQKSDQIIALEAQFHLLNSMNISKGSSDESESESSVSTTFTESIGSPISRTSTDDSQENLERETPDSPHQKIPRNSPKAHARFNDANEADGQTFQKTIKNKAIQSPSDEEVVSCASTEQASVLSSLSSVHVKRVTTCEEQEEIERLKEEVNTANLKYEKFKEVCHGAFSKMNDVEGDLERTKDALIATIHKRDHYKDHLRDVINQYKELHGEHAEALYKIESLEAELKILAEENVALEGEISNLEEQKKELLQIRRETRDKILVAEGIFAPENTDEALVEAYQRFKERIVTLERKLELAKREAGANVDKKDGIGRKLRDAVAKYTKLEQEKELMEARVARGDEDIRTARKEAQRQKEGAKHTRRRLAAYVKKIKKLETGQNIVLGAVTEANPTQSVDFDGVLRRMLLVEINVACKAWNEKMKLVREKEVLDKENDELKTFCEDMLNEVGTVAKN